ncbi:MAG TPA: TadE/TadG family type IV pilus assembly protein [Methylomirabilota bacterium]|nr:TadE/TadG family type IV pilus assembly protein [Methylomirabilota bacterium]
MNEVRARNGQRGSSTVELLFTLPMLFLIMFGVVEASRAWLTASIVNAAAREGARIGVRTPTLTGDAFNPAPAEAEIDAMLTGLNLSAGASRSVTCAAPCLPGSPVTATVSVPFTSILPILDAALGTVNITEAAVMRFE